MASRNALPAHLKSSAMSNGDAEGAFQQKHHGKSQSHVVSKMLCDLHVEDSPFHVLTAAVNRCSFLM